MLKLTDETELDTDKAKSLFLEQYLQNPSSINKLCDSLRINRRTFYHWRKNDPDFDREFLEAQAMLVHFLEDEAYRRAVTGVQKPVFQGGVQVGVITEYSDTLLALLLKANAPGKYKDKPSNEINLAINDTKLIHVHSNVPLAADEIDIVQEQLAESIPYEEMPKEDTLDAL